MQQPLQGYSESRYSRTMPDAAPTPDFSGETIGLEWGTFFSTQYVSWLWYALFWVLPGEHGSAQPIYIATKYLSQSVSFYASSKHIKCSFSWTRIKHLLFSQCTITSHPLHSSLWPYAAWASKKVFEGRDYMGLGSQCLQDKVIICKLNHIMPLTFFPKLILQLHTYGGLWW